MKNSFGGILQIMTQTKGPPLLHPLTPSRISEATINPPWYIPRRPFSKSANLWGLRLWNRFSTTFEAFEVSACLCVCVYVDACMHVCVCLSTQSLEDGTEHLLTSFPGRRYKTECDDSRNRRCVFVCVSVSLCVCVRVCAFLDMCMVGCMCVCMCVYTERRGVQCKGR